MCVCVVCHAVNTHSSYLCTLRHSLVQKQVDVDMQSMYLLNEYNKDGHHSQTYIFNG